MSYGGRTAEEIVFGRDRVTTGAASDIQQATAIARRYVTQWGLSEAIGPVLVGDNEQELFLGREIQHRREVSEQTAQIVDSEVKRVIEEAYSRAKKTLEDNLDLLHMVAGALLERETLTREDIAILSKGGVLPPRVSGAAPGDTAEELRRVIPVITALADAIPDAVLSVDTVKADVASSAMEAGAHVVNDVSAFRLDPRMGEICASHGAGVVLMHSRGSVSEMGTYTHASYDDVVDEVLEELRERVSTAISAGVAEECVAVDPGIGFAKRGEHSLRLLAAIP